ncbi:MAG: Rpn family recombination-promoting nuclease/putative transposase [Acidobacteria bacterium]|nr:Rpn family recombination-promoting nuclease/putative transposase [Acidobacteriota bacterium]
MGARHGHDTGRWRTRHAGRNGLPARLSPTGIMTDTRPTHDAAYKQLFSQPRMVRDLLDGFAARGWIAALNLDTLTALPASYVGHDLRQRHGDLVWRVRFRDDRWLYLVLLLEFQSDVDRSMAVAC